jgi:hypothetical protein
MIALAVSVSTVSTVSSLPLAITLSISPSSNRSSSIPFGLLIPPCAHFPTTAITISSRLIIDSLVVVLAAVTFSITIACSPALGTFFIV